MDFSGPTCFSLWVFLIESFLVFSVFVGWKIIKLYVFQCFISVQCSHMLTNCIGKKYWMFFVHLSPFIRQIWISKDVQYLDIIAWFLTIHYEKSFRDWIYFIKCFPFYIFFIISLYSGKISFHSNKKLLQHAHINKEFLLMIELTWNCQQICYMFNLIAWSVSDTLLH